ncbi:hypothetical protein [Halorussus sp. MSC15.2]|uniref:hypothetical protein n=1 Tax=Halorussus sp. MSC15.2 TaxID=2283638 RepID=UPI0013CFC026|nr:hypothetical protein [Halorussus sp. MSC15.2]NEU57501.1 hypothetical protein [Halorussus sp. MSC15.2]
MNALVANLGARVVLPSLVVTGVLYAVVRVLDWSFTERTTGAKRTAAAVVALGLYFLGHPLYPAFVPLIRGKTPWLYAVAGAYLTLGAYSVGHVHVGRHFRDGRPSTVGPWLAAAVGVAVAVLAERGFDPAALVRFIRRVSGGSVVVSELLLSLSLALQFPLGHDRRRRSAGTPSPRLLLLPFALYAAVLIWSLPLTEHSLGPITVVFVAFGCIGALLGAPAYVLGTTLATRPRTERSDAPDARRE